MARIRNYKAEYAARQAKAKAQGTSYGKARYTVEKQSAQAQGFTSPKAAKKAGRKVSAGITRKAPAAPARVDVGKSLTVWRLDSSYDLGRMRAGLAGMPDSTAVVIAGDLMGRSGPVRIYLDTTLDEVRRSSHRKLMDDLADQAAADYGGNWSGAPSNVQATTARPK